MPSHAPPDAVVDVVVPCFVDDEDDDEDDDDDTSSTEGEDAWSCSQEAVAVAVVAVPSCGLDRGSTIACTANAEENMISIPTQGGPGVLCNPPKTDATVVAAHMRNAPSSPIAAPASRGKGSSSALCA